MKRYERLNIDTPRGNWKAVPLWYKIVSFLCALISTIAISIGAYVIFLSKLELFWVFAILLPSAFIYFYISYKFGILGGKIGNWFRFYLHPKSIHALNPQTSDVFELKIKWAYQMQLLGIMLGNSWLILLIVFLGMFMHYASQLMGLK